MKVFLGNTFPLNLVRQPVQIVPVPLDVAVEVLKDSGFESFWGHSNTIQAANSVLGLDVTPTIERPALALVGDGHSVKLNDIESNIIVVLSPNYKTNFRPAIGVEVGADQIESWSALIVEIE